MTRQGLGFPQYANDDVVIPALTAMGYSLEDARNYVVAACWEFIIPGVAMDIPNIGAVSLAGVVADVIRGSLTSAVSYEALEKKGTRGHPRDAERGCKAFAALHEPAPWQTVLMSDCEP